MNLKFLSRIIAILIMCTQIYSQQITIRRIENMPNMPSPYLMRDWKKVAVGYDSLVFNLNLTGTYLPLIWINNNSVNYPGDLQFGLHTVVGTTVPTSAEAINSIPAVIGATLAGIDKSNQNGYDWVKMSKEWFNKKNGLNVYKNHPDDENSDDFWYETMPNIFFYQLYYLYPGVNIFKSQFTTVANRWLEVVKKMGGGTTPWQIPNMKYQGWDFSTMKPFAEHVHDEPEAAGAIAWLLYNAYKQTGNSEYRIGAELSMEYLNSLNSNPAYEIQLPYGVYIAAKMNAELGTNYDITKMLKWCFNTGNIRSWGVINGKWGGYDVDGLIGEVNGSNDYPFAMNTFEQIGALVPLVRYDERFARTIGKWVLNAANAARLFYPEYLPTRNQDRASKLWADQYDPNSYIAHEAMHQYDPSNFNISPFASGDAINGGWGKTNLTLYGSSHVGILGGIIDTTNVEGILKLDVLKTDYYRDKAFPTFLYYNPYSVKKNVVLNVGSDLHDIYDLVSKKFINTAVTGNTLIGIPANSAVLAVITPSGGAYSYIQDKFMINGVVVDFHSGKFSGNYPPRIKSLTAEKNKVIIGDTISIYSTAVDPDEDSLSYNWYATSGVFIEKGAIAKWIAPKFEGKAIITNIVSDGHNNQTSANDTISVVKSINQIPFIQSIRANPLKMGLDSTTELTCFAKDLDGDSLKYTWKAKNGIITGNGASVQWAAPDVAGNYFIKCTVNDGHGGVVSDSIGVEVRDFSHQQTGQLAAYYPFNGNADDFSGFHNNGIVHNVTLTADRFNNPNSAYYFNGVNSFIEVPSDSNLNFQKSITINFWIKIDNFPAREEYVISHGSYENRWKISILTDKYLRWTIHTSDTKNNGIIDLDSETKLKRNTWYNISVLYDGVDCEIYLNGNLDSFSPWSGSILKTSIPLTIGQMLPNNNNYNFNGILDDIRIYNYALPFQKIKELYDFKTGLKNEQEPIFPYKDVLEQNFPNPFNPSTKISFWLKNSSFVTLVIYNLLGQKITTLINKYLTTGKHSINWDADGLSSGIYFSILKTKSYTLIRKMVLLR